MRERLDFITLTDSPFSDYYYHLTSQINKYNGPPDHKQL